MFAFFTGSISRLVIPPFHLQVVVKVNGAKVLDTKLIDVFRMWEETSYQLEKLQANTNCVTQEWKGLSKRKGVSYNVTFDPSAAIVKTSNVKVAVLREEGTNGDREMIASLLMSNFEVFDVTMSDLQAKKISLDAFQGVVFPGGFSYAGEYSRLLFSFNRINYKNE